MQNVYTSLKVTKVICSSVYEVQCTIATTILLENFQIEQIALDIEWRKEMLKNIEQFIIHILYMN